MLIEFLIFFFPFQVMMQIAYFYVYQSTEPHLNVCMIGVD